MTNSEFWSAVLNFYAQIPKYGLDIVHCYFDKRSSMHKSAGEIWRISRYTLWIFVLLSLCQGGLAYPTNQFQLTSKEVGTSCAADLSSAQMDILLYVDVTANVDVLKESGRALLNPLSGFKLDGGQTGSCLRLYFYHVNIWSSSEREKECLTYEQVVKALNNVTAQHHSDFYPDYNAIIRHAHKTFNVTKDTSKESKTLPRPKLMIATSDLFSYYLPTTEIYEKATELKENGVFIASIKTGNEMKLEFQKALVTVTTPGQVFNVFEPNFEDNLYNALTYANCRCPADSTQFTAFNPRTGHLDYFADCFQLVTEKPRISFFAERECERRKGSLASLNSPAKLAFLEENFAPQNILDSEDYHVGLHQRRDESLVWYYYQRESYKLASNEAPLFRQEPTQSRADTVKRECGFVRRLNGGKQFSVGLADCSRKLPFICQLRAQ
ncbi:lectin c-type domain-containing protein [Ditylenchus destructor]|nr:lectin c-type domain-containing protein [Ditylenchus destructor]